MDEDLFDPLNQAVASLQHSLFQPPASAAATDPDGDTRMADVDAPVNSPGNDDDDNDPDALEDLATLATLRAELAKTAVARTHLSTLTSLQEQSQETHARMLSDQAQRATLAAIEARQAKVAALERQLDEKIEYERQMAEVRKVPSRDETRRVIEAYEREINGLKEQLEARAAKADAGRKRMYRAMNAILELKEGLVEATAERVAMRKEMDGQEQERAGGKGQGGP
ncbi:hypothetical protein BCR44DRAFT_40164 [Catenaria anguillulae PL171]|uniref:Uncharacterized protein n=1 Tax=Catenaria anguillulae PL171 TaxID=765915 RepID=A0A1Y2I0T9_9FUNG|nr:hypothetical protein BCR44DRAFT_40164 [Catenaria anguillulae PL171]